MQNEAVYAHGMDAKSYAFSQKSKRSFPQNGPEDIRAFSGALKQQTPAAASSIRPVDS